MPCNSKTHERSGKLGKLWETEEIVKTEKLQEMWES